MPNIHSIRIHSQDNVATLCEDGNQGDMICVNGNSIALKQDCTLGNKIALVALKTGDKIMKYNAAIGTCTQSIEAGDWVHGHNLSSDYMKSEGEEMIDE